jgi:radical SAM protein with 4Fe4S-binding SPASM domain
MDFMGYRTRFLDADVMETRLAELGELGVKAVMFAGEGEPLLHSHVDRMAAAAYAAGIDVSFTTNAVPLKPALSERLLPVSSWIKISCNAGNPTTYSRIHRADAGDFDRVMSNAAAAATVRARHGYGCTLGFQCILLPETAHDMVALARRVRDIGADYLVVKPYIGHPQSIGTSYSDVGYSGYDELAHMLAEEETEAFRVVFRLETMKRWDEKKALFTQCLALPFWSYIDAGGNVWGCSRHLGQKEFNYGNIYADSFTTTWKGKHRQESLTWCGENLNIQACHVTCRMEVINSYLRRLKHPEPHDNFI